ncbi:hypothetical protein QAD02_022500, partial [Eretmocerus hayati]
YTDENVSQIFLNDVIDTNIDDIKSVLGIIDPTILPDIKLKHGHFFDGHLRNISLVKRTGNCSAKYSDKMLSFNFNMGWTNSEIVGDYEYRYTFLFIERKGNLSGIMDHLSFDLALDIDLKHYLIILRSIQITDIG